MIKVNGKLQLPIQAGVQKVIFRDDGMSHSSRGEKRPAEVLAEYGGR